MKKRIPHILLLVDKRGWAFDICAQEYSRYLSDEFSFTIKYVEERPVLLPFFFDLIHVFWWGEKYYQHFFWPKRKILKEVSSHRWEDDLRYGPCTPEEMTEKYLYDATTVICTSKILYSKINPFFPDTYLVDNGYSPAKFQYTKPRTGKNLTLCWVGNDKDTVKGINDILLPAAGNEYVINIATNIKHDNLCAFYNEYDLFLVGSKHEASPIPLIEAMACGCFPVCTNVGIVPDLIQHKQNGYVVENRTIEDFKKAFLWCKENIQFVRDAGRLNSQIIYEKRRWEICSETFRKAYREALMSARVKQ
jgi:glycosyltransferase involved in cell wall biosynthesis